MRFFNLTLAVTFAMLFGAQANAECQDLKTTQAIVDYVCAYSLVSNTQCDMWREDMRQAQHNTEIIVDSFISWNSTEFTLVEHELDQH